MYAPRWLRLSEVGRGDILPRTPNYVRSPRENRLDFRLKSYEIEQERKARRDAQRRAFRRNQALGLLMLAAAVLTYRLMHTPSGWLFPAGWWRLW